MAAFRSVTKDSVIARQNGAELCEAGDEAPFRSRDFATRRGDPILGLVSEASDSLVFRVYEQLLRAHVSQMDRRQSAA